MADMFSRLPVECQTTEVRSYGRASMLAGVAIGGVAGIVVGFAGPPMLTGLASARRNPPDTMTLLFAGAGALVAYYLLKNAGKGAQPAISMDQPGQNSLPPSGVTD